MKAPTPAKTKPAVTSCLRCGGSGVETTVLEKWDEVSGLLRSLMWPEKRITQFRNSLRRGDIIWQLRALSVETQAPDGKRRSFYKEPGVRTV